MSIVDPQFSVYEMFDPRIKGDAKGEYNAVRLGESRLRMGCGSQYDSRNCSKNTLAAEFIPFHIQESLTLGVLDGWNNPKAMEALGWLSKQAILGVKLAIRLNEDGREVDSTSNELIDEICKLSEVGVCPPRKEPV